MNSITIFTDGSSRGNPGPGGWAAVIVSQGGLSQEGNTSRETHITELGGREGHTTNNRMELTAALEGLSFVGRILSASPLHVVVNSDSSYVINGITKWVHGWEKKNWITTQKEEVVNRDLWEALISAVRSIEKKSSGNKVSWNYVGGHVGVLGNERCDEIATAFADGETPELFDGPISSYSIKDILNISRNQDAGEKRTASKSRSKAAAYSYVSFVDGTLNIDHSWNACEARVKGKKGARFKKSLNKADEGAIVTEFTSQN